MRRELAEKIYKACPIIYRGRIPNKPSTSLMLFGFECGSGWYEMLLMLSVSIEQIAREMKGCDTPNEDLPIVSQVKEKFGGLRFYVHNGNEAIYKLISQAEQSSYGICERCGASGRLIKLGPTVMTRCKEHTDEPYE